MDAMNDALKHLNERKAAYKEQIASYNNYVDSAMSTLQRGKGYALPARNSART